MDRSPFDINDTFAFKEVLFFGRTLSEYAQMFNLDVPALMGKRVLDCPSGPASFVAECKQQGIEAVGCDPMYDKDTQELARLTQDERQETLDRQARVRHLFDEDKPIADYGKAKFQAFDHFCNDYKEGLLQQRYIKAALPQLPFGNDSFHVALSSNFLFLYSDYEQGGMLLDSPFDYQFHLQSILELMRLSREARIYPLKGPHNHEHVYVPRILQELHQLGFRAELVPVPYRDVKGAYHMMRVGRTSG